MKEHEHESLKQSRKWLVFHINFHKLIKIEVISVIINTLKGETRATCMHFKEMCIARRHMRKVLWAQTTLLYTWSTLSKAT